jgi:3-dehydroquinate synthase
MEVIKVSIANPASTYTVCVGDHILVNLKKIVSLELYSKIIVITDANVSSLHERYITQHIPYIHSICVIPSGEENKTIESVECIWSHLHTSRVDRKSLVINIGGGVIGDVGGFAASTYMRGIDFIQIPTTLLSMVDASVGGKTGINFKSVKNLVGSFQQPIAVLADTYFLSSLPDRELRSGLAEMIKHGLISSSEHVSHINTLLKESAHKDSLAAHKSLPILIYESICIKKQVVEQDPSEIGMRKILNFGHTIGHAIEVDSHTTPSPLTHGEAVAIGMVAESCISDTLGISKGLSDRIRKMLIHAHLPTQYARAHSEAIIKLIQSDKKNVSGKVLFSLVTHIGNCAWNIEVNDVVIRKALKYISL